MFEEREKEKLSYSQHFGDYANVRSATSEKWLQYQKNGELKYDVTNINEAPIGEFIEKPTPPKKLTFNADLWYGVRPGGTKQKRLEKNQVLTEKSVSIVRSTSKKKDGKVSSAESNGEIKRIVGTFVPFEPVRIVEGDDLMSATVVNGTSGMIEKRPDGS